MATGKGIKLPEHIGKPREVDYSGAPADNYGPLARDRVPVRSMRETDLRALIAIDRQSVGRDRTAYITAKLNEALRESDVRVSLVAEQDGVPVGFIMARVDLGAYGQTESSAVMDTIGVNPDYRGHGVGRALLSQLLANLATLRVDKLLTEIDWGDRDLMAYLASCRFKPATRLSFDFRIA